MIGRKSTSINKIVKKVVTIQECTFVPFDKGISNRSNIGNGYYSNKKGRGERPKKKHGIHILICLFVLGQWYAVLIGYGKWRRFSLSHYHPSHFLRIINNSFSFSFFSLFLPRFIKHPKARRSS